MTERPSITSSDGSKRVGDVVAADSVPPLGLDGAELTFVRVDHQARLQFDETEVVIGTPFRLTDSSAEHSLDPEDRACLGPLLALYPGTLSSAVVASDCSLRLSFEGGAVVEVARHPRYEAWQIVGPASRLIVCPPADDDAGLVVWN